jgi:hypothetical protein
MKEKISAYSKLTTWLREQKGLDGYGNGDPIDHKQICTNVFLRKKKEIRRIGIIKFCVDFTLHALSRVIFKKRQVGDDDQQVSFGFYEEMRVHKPLIQLLLDFEDKRVYDPVLDKLVALYSLSIEQVTRIREYYAKKTGEMIDKTQILEAIEKMMLAHDYTHVSEQSDEDS